MSQSIDQREIERVLKGLTPEARALVEKTLKEQAEGNVATLEALRGVVYAHRPPPMDEFIFSKEYLGLPKDGVFPAIEELLYRIDHPDVREVWICAGKGSGKSTLTSVTMARQAHNVAVCMRDPSAFFKLLPDALTAIVNMSISSAQAENVMFNKFYSLLSNARCFNPNSTPIYNKRKRHIEMANNVHALSGHSGYQAFFGYDVFCGVLDEFSWFKDKQDKSISDEIFSGILGSAKSRFPGYYKIVSISSPQAMDDPIMRRVQEAIRMGGEPHLAGNVLEAEMDGDSYAKVLEKFNKPINPEDTENGG